MNSGRLVVAILLVAALTSCGDPPPEAWRRIDLTRLEPVVDVGAARVKTILLGSGHRRPQHRDEAEPPAAVGGEIRALTALAGSILRFAVELGDEPFLSFVPRAAADRACELRYVVSVVDEASRSELWNSPAPPWDLAAPATVHVDLARWTGRAVDLELATTAGPACTLGVEAAWGSAAVHHRRALARSSATPPPAAPPNIVLLGLDTLRADALGAYGRAPSPSPTLDRLAGESDCFLRAFSTFNITNPSFASILTGLYGKEHGVYDLQTPLAAHHRTLAELLREAGYSTAVIYGARHLGARRLLFDQGFDHRVLPLDQFAAELAVDHALDWLQEGDDADGAGKADDPRPFFLFLHLFDPHTPHTPPRPYADGLRPQQPPGIAPVRDWTAFRAPGLPSYEREWLGGERDLYAGEIAYLDRQIGRLLDFLSSRGLLENTVVAVVADHGENLGEHDVFYRHAGLWDTTTHVPLMIRWPRRDELSIGRRVDGLVQTLDLFPTLLRAAGVEPPPSSGVDLRQAADGAAPPRRIVFAEHADRHGAMARTADFLYARLAGHPHLADGPRLYDLRADPEQQRNLAGQGHPEEARLADLLERWLAERTLDAPAALPLSDEEIRRLRSLGYLDASPDVQ